jgi:hypothetical protein
VEIAAGILAIACLAASPPLSAAEERKDGPGIRFDDELLSHLEGRWALTRSIRGTTERNTVEAGWVLDHQFLRLAMKDVATPPKYEAHVYVGWSNTDRRYVIHWMDLWGGHYSSRGFGKRSGDAVEFRFADGEGAFFNTFTYDRAKDTWTMVLESGDRDGKRSPFAVDRLEKAR